MSSRQPILASTDFLESAVKKLISAISGLCESEKAVEKFTTLLFDTLSIRENRVEVVGL